MSKPLACPLCHSKTFDRFAHDKRRDYMRCPECLLVFVPESMHLTAEQEKAEYDKHQNALDDKGYLNFLSRTYQPLLQRLPANSSGLDFGCGPAPALAEQLRQHGHSMALYDHYYFPDDDVLSKKYDFITCTEVIEHLGKPDLVLSQLKQLLKPEGLIAIMTKRVIDQARFQNWHYKNDPTHICFYSEQTFDWIARYWQMSLEIIDEDVVFLHNGTNTLNKA